PGALVALAGGLALGGLAGVGGTPVGDIPSGLPSLSLDLPWEELAGLVVPGAIIALVGFAEPASIARTYATRDRPAASADRARGRRGARTAGSSARASPTSRPACRAATRSAARSRGRR